MNTRYVLMKSVSHCTNSNWCTREVSFLQLKHKQDLATVQSSLHSRRKRSMKLSGATLLRHTALRSKLTPHFLRPTFSQSETSCGFWCIFHGRGVGISKAGFIFLWRSGDESRPDAWGLTNLSQRSLNILWTQCQSSAEHYSEFSLLYIPQTQLLTSHTQRVRDRLQTKS